MSEINVHELSERLTSTFRSYLYTTNLVSDSEPELRRAVFDALGQRDVFARGPLVSAIPAYAPAESGADLMQRTEAPMLHLGLERCDPSQFDLSRPLYRHQVESIEKIQQGRNIVVATGTGSGKTECFLLPILNDALRNPGKGVRAIVVYPMNALANDQLDRLRKMLGEIPEVSFGRYTGDTPKDRRGLDPAVVRAIGPNERFTREEIQSDPPDILLTNFAMLEYLLIRPADSPIFGQNRLQYIVLDEAHTYNGAQGIDVGLLMRRLRERFAGNRVQFILTSATIAEGKSEQAREDVAKFGSALTGASFDPPDIIFGDTVDHQFSVETPVGLSVVSEAVPTDEALAEWIASLDDEAALRARLTSSVLPNADQAVTAQGKERILFELLHDWAPLAAMSRAIRRGAHDIEALSLEAWGSADEPALRATKWLLILAANAAERADATALLKCRFHFFFRGLGGASVCLSPSCDGRTAESDARWSRLYLEARRRCEEPCGKLVFPLTTCSQCGMPAITGWKGSGGNRLESLQQAGSTGSTKLVLTWDSTFAEDSGDESDDEIAGESRVRLCTSCGTCSEDRLPVCCEKPELISLTRLSVTDDGDVRQCPRCAASARPMPSVLREFRSGDDATTAVLAEELVRNLPPDSSTADLPADGRRLLVFSDSRQRAAFFAPYLKRTTADSVFTHRLLETICRAEVAIGEPVSLPAVTERFANDAMRLYPFAVFRTFDEKRQTIGYSIVPARKLKPAQRLELKRQATIVLLQHFCSSSRRRSTLPGLALASSEVGFSEGAKEALVSALPEIFSPSVEEGFDLVQQLLQMFLLKRALGFGASNVTCRDIGEGPISYAFHSTLSGAVGSRQRVRWNPYSALAQRAAVIERSFVATAVAKHLALSPRTDEEVVRSLLDRIWEVLSEEVLSRAGDPGEFHLELDDVLLSTRHTWNVCERCGRLTVFPGRGFCLAPRCDGRLKQLDEAALARTFANHHYRRRLQSKVAMALEVKEHTAQLTNERGKEYQQDFVAGKINVLSSSTTFEMGVDVGSLKAVFLRNVPPSASNYIQRAGRAGRRRGGAAFAVTFCRQTPHDLFHFYDPAAIVEGRVPVPRINLKNVRLTQRHVNSFLLGAYLRPHAGAKLNVEWFFSPDAPEKSPAGRYAEFLRKNARMLCNSLAAILPAECGLTPEECIDASGATLFGGEDSVYEEHVNAPLESFKAQLDDLSAMTAGASGDELMRIGRAQNVIGRLADSLRGERLIDFLSAAHWLPSYAFPQDTVRLRVNQPDWTSKMRLERDREYGIAEYAPGSEVIADGSVFTSRAIVKKGREFDFRKYRSCPSCRQLRTWNAVETPEAVCGCKGPGQDVPVRDYVIPHGFQTLITDPVPEPSLFRLTPPSNSEIFLVAGAAPEDFVPHARLAGVSYAYRSDGELFRANLGLKNRRFRVCSACGRGFDHGEKLSGPHETPWGTHCRGTVRRIDLAHQFKTDTLQLRFDGAAPRPVYLSGDEPSQSFWLSLQTAFVAAAAEVLTIPRSDIEGTYRSQTGESLSGELVVYDRVPGGAGYVERIVEELPRVLERTLQRTLSCENPLCDPEASCYVCLRSYSNQFRWSLLRRNSVSTWLGAALPSMKNQTDSVS